MQTPRMTDNKTYYETAIRALDDALKGPEFNHYDPERAFIKWYAMARYGPSKKCEITDGPSDGGIDAIVEEGDVSVVVQAKYSVNRKLANATPKDLQDFSRVRRLMTVDDAEVDFEAWLQTVRAPLRAKYKALRKRGTRSVSQLRFDFVTTKQINTHLGADCEKVDISRIAPLWTLYEEGFTPPTDEIEVEFEDLWSNGREGDTVNYVGIADVRVFLKLMERDEHERLFAQNVRTDLRTTLNKGIRETYETSPDTFWMGNNGIYIVCSAAQGSGKTLKLVYPSIINGSQTLHSLFDSRVRHRCRILVRVLQTDVHANRALVGSIIKRTNSQNAMKMMNLAAHDREQLNIARFLDGLAFFYERREGEWKNEKKTVLHDYFPVTMKDVAQWSAVTVAGIGIGSARNQVKSLFGEKRYRAIFSRFSDDLTALPYKNLALTLLSGLIVRRWLRSLPATRRGSARIAQLLMVKLVFDAMVEAEALPGRATQALSDRVFKSADFDEIFASLNRAHGVVLAEQKRMRARDETFDLSNYFKRDENTEAIEKKLSSATLLKSLRRALDQALVD